MLLYAAMLAIYFCVASDETISKPSCWTQGIGEELLGGEAGSLHELGMVIVMSSFSYGWKDVKRCKHMRKYVGKNKNRSDPKMMTQRLQLCWLEMSELGTLCQSCLNILSQQGGQEAPSERNGIGFARCLLTWFTSSKE